GGCCEVWRRLGPRAERRGHAERGPRHRSYRLAHYDGPRREGCRAQSQGREVYDRASTGAEHPHVVRRGSRGSEDRVAAAVKEPWMVLDERCTSLVPTARPWAICGAVPERSILRGRHTWEFCPMSPSTAVRSDISGSAIWC